jgi:hypothetical protein
VTARRRQSSACKLFFLHGLIIYLSLFWTLRTRFYRQATEFSAWCSPCDLSIFCTVNRSINGELSLPETVRLALCMDLRVRLLEST